MKFLDIGLCLSYNVNKLPVDLLIGIINLLFGNFYIICVDIGMIKFFRGD